MTEGNASLNRSLLVLDADPRRAARADLALRGVTRSVREGAWRVRHLTSLAALAREDLSHHTLVMCDMALTDGTGMDALAYIRAARPALPVVMTAREVDPALTMEAIAAGAIDCLARRDDLHERLPVMLAKCLAIHQVVGEREHMQRRLSASIEQLADEVARLQTMVAHLETAAGTDDLTGLHNRRQLNMAMDLHWARCDRHDEDIAFLMIDVDRFKQFNDELGHQAGDSLLRLLGRVLRDNTRQTDVVARYGGDEFCVVMAHLSVEDTLHTAERIAAAFEEAAAAYPGAGGRVGLSIGVAHTALSRPGSPTQLMSQADEAMYAAKRLSMRVMARGERGVIEPARAA